MENRYFLQPRWAIWNRKNHTGTEEMSINRRSLQFATFLIAASFSQSHAADIFPSKPIKIIVANPAGSSSDVYVREIAPLVSAQLRQPVVIDNRPGAGGNIGAAAAAKSQADGHTILYTVNSTVAVSPHLYKNPGYDPIKELIPFIVTIRVGGMLIVAQDSPIKSVKDLIARAKDAPGKLTYASAGPGTPQHLLGERFKKLTNIDLLHVPYKGEPAAITDLLGGQVDTAFAFPFATIPFIKSGKVRALGVGTASRSTALPSIPTLSESGVTGFDEEVWGGFSVPAGTPKSTIDILYQAFRAAASDPKFRQSVESRGSEAVVSSQEDAVAWLRRDFDRYGKIARELNLRLE